MDFFKKLSFHNTETDHSFFVLSDKINFNRICINDLFLLDNNENTKIINAMQHFLNWFKIINFDNIFYYFGIKIDINLNQKIIILQ